MKTSQDTQLEQIYIIVKGSAYGILRKDNSDRVYIEYYCLDGSEVADYRDRKHEIEAIVSEAKVYCIKYNLILWSY